ncbi:MAG: ATP-dependent DNA helicase RecG [Candidatus Marinimicrobia bacterium]|nr:ATP-dependent DNA helicase RecG [Candidatus Neomarinimicrobiota bacterium]
MNTSNTFYQTTPESDITYLKGVGPRRGAVLKAHGIHTIRDLLYYIPRKYLDRTLVMSINQLRIGDEAVVIGKVLATGSKKTRNRSFFQVTISDGSGMLTCVWFRHSPWITEKFTEGELVAFYGKVEFYNGLKLVHPDFDLLDTGEDPVNTGQILATYPSTGELKSVGFDSRGFRRVIRNVFSALDQFPVDPIKDLSLSLPLITLTDALKTIHQPQCQEDIPKALYRLKFEEHFFFQLLMALRRKVLREIVGRVFDQQGAYVKEMYEKLPFKLTDAQIKVLREIRSNLKSPSQMNRLLQGDVGSGKTVVAMLTAALVIGNGAQVAVMAPTEILAEQHLAGFTTFCDLVDIQIVLLKGGIRGDQRQDILDDIRTGKTQLVVGTHALIQEDVVFKDLGLIIVDEQHRFGVDQRKSLMDKGWSPEMLVMTATPIPRTLAITYHGDMDVSVIDELPSGRKTIKTTVVKPTRLPKVYDFIRKEISQGRQCFVVYPVIEESEKPDIEAAETGYRYLKEKIFNASSVGYINGRMKTDERTEQMRKFERNETQILVATTVIEVGIDIPNATVMVVENAERFGLAQLHQLRGRIGRGAHQSFCILVERKKTENGRQRLKVMERTIDGFQIADEDLAMRGPGEFFGTQQSGYAKSRIVNFREDGAVIQQARHAAFEIVDRDPHLTATAHRNLRKRFTDRYQSMLDLVNIG